MKHGTGIQWTHIPGYQGETTNPVTGCDKVSPGCKNCYAERLANGRLKHLYPDGFGKVTLHPERLVKPLHWKKPRGIFVCSMSDLFHNDVPDRFIDQVFAVAALCPQHIFFILTKRPERMLAYMVDIQTPFRVARQKDILSASRQLDPEEVLPISGYPGYFASSHGFIYSDKRGRRRKMKPDVGEQGHQRISLYREGSGEHGERFLVHRIILETFVGQSPSPNAQGRHLDGVPTNNAVSNLRWGTQSENWDDSKRHGSHRRYAKITEDDATEIRRRHATEDSVEALAREFGISATQIRNIASGAQWAIKAPITWPLSQCWLGVSVESPDYYDRIQVLRQIPAAIRFISLEPLLARMPDLPLEGIDQVILGCESGPRRRHIGIMVPFSIVRQCKAAGVPVFVKQLSLYGRVSHDPNEWPEELRVREFPEVTP